MIYGLRMTKIDDGVGKAVRKRKGEVGGDCEGSVEGNQ